MTATCSPNKEGGSRGTDPPQTNKQTKKLPLHRINPAACVNLMSLDFVK